MINMYRLMIDIIYFNFQTHSTQYLLYFATQTWSYPYHLLLDFIIFSYIKNNLIIEYNGFKSQYSTVDTGVNQCFGSFLLLYLQKIS